jgi:hypothetical protein
MEFRILGPFEVSEHGQPLEVGAGKQRALLAVLLLRAGEVVYTDHLIDALWDERPPASALNSVHIYSQLRKALDGRLEPQSTWMRDYSARRSGAFSAGTPSEADLGRPSLLQRHWAGTLRRTTNFRTLPGCGRMPIGGAQRPRRTARQQVRDAGHLAPRADDGAGFGGECPRRDGEQARMS